MNGKAIKDLRKSLKDSQTKFGKKLGVTRDAVAKYETEQLLPRDEVLKKLNDLITQNPVHNTRIANRRVQASIATNIGLMKMFNTLDIEDRKRIFDITRTAYILANKEILNIVPE